MEIRDQRKALRESTGMNRKEFCACFGIPYRTMTEWERGESQASRLCAEDDGIAIKEGEVEEKRKVHFWHIVDSDKPVKSYRLGVIISVGYRVKSRRGVEFRRWA